MLRVLLIVLMIGQVAVCPFSCAVEVVDQGGVCADVATACSCCANSGPSEQSAPKDKDHSDNDCECFCNGNALKTSIVSYSADTQSIWTAISDQLVPEVAFADLEHDQPPIRNGSGKALRLAVQSLVL